MAAPSYVTNLSDFEDFETASTVSTELVGYTATAKGEDLDSDFPIQGTYHASAEQRTAATGSLASDYGTNLTWTSGWNIFLWGMFLAPAAVNTDANAGIEMAIGPDISNFYRWTVGGNDFGRYPYGGWQNFVVNPEVTTGRSNTGTPTANYRWVGMCCDVISAIAKGSPYGIDVIRYGRGDIDVTLGDLANGYATFVGMAAQNDNNSNRWGLFSSQSGSYIYKGLMSLGTSGVAVDFRDSNRSIVIDNTRRVLSTFNRIEINNDASNVEWTNITITSLSTVSPGQLEVIDNLPDVVFDGCTFSNMDTFIFQTGSTITNSTFNQCAQITSGGGEFTGTKVLESSVVADASAFVWNDTKNPDGYLDDMVFSKGATAHHAIEFTDVIPSSITLNGLDFIDFNAIDEQNDSTLYFADTTGIIDVYLVGCTGDISSKSAGATINLISDPVTLEITTVDADTQVIVTGVTVLAWVTDDTNFPYQDSVTISGSSTTATVTHTAHGLDTGDDIWIEGVNQENYYGAYPITKIDDNHYSYTTVETITVSPATGTITATFCFINGYTDATGKISDTRVVNIDQPFAYRCRKGTTSPLYKTSAGTNTLDNVLGKSITVNLISDE